VVVGVEIAVDGSDVGEHDGRDLRRGDEVHRRVDPADRRGRALGVGEGEQRRPQRRRAARAADLSPASVEEEHVAGLRIRVGRHVWYFTNAGFDAERLLERGLAVEDGLAAATGAFLQALLVPHGFAGTRGYVKHGGTADAEHEGIAGWEV